jgi:glutathione synthase/RimK-type ligase-like ATP-grasp enzyme
MTVGILGWRDDPHVLAVQRELLRRGAGCKVFDIYTPGSFSASLDAPDGSDTCPARLPFETIWRRIKPPFLLDYQDPEDYYQRGFILDEWRVAFNFMLLDTPDQRVVNNLRAELDASNKLRQLEIAAGCGLVVPQTLCTNDPGKVGDFLHRQQGNRCIHKTLGAFLSPTARIKFATVLDNELLARYRDNIRVCPSLFQQLINARHELRVSVVGDSVFPVRITKPAEDVIDWRRTSQSNSYSPATLDPAIETALLKCQHALGLDFGAYDLIEDRNGQTYFLEVNPAGQWLWLEEATGMPIASALAGLLSQPGARSQA